MNIKINTEAMRMDELSVKMGKKKRESRTKIWEIQTWIFRGVMQGRIICTGNQ